MSRCTCAGTAPGWPQHELFCVRYQGDQRRPAVVPVDADDVWGPASSLALSQSSGCSTVTLPAEQPDHHQH